MNFWKKRDPLNYYEKKLSKKFKNFKKIELKMQNKINKLIKEAFIFAEKSKFPKEFIKKNYINSYKNIKKFYQNKIKFEAYRSQTNLNRIKFVIEKNKRILTFAEELMKLSIKL